jgi:transmembrane sensor
MNENSTYYTDLITRYFAGEISGDELVLLSDWLKTDEQNREIFVQHQKTWHLIEKKNIQSIINVDNEWISMQSKMNATIPENQNPTQVISLNQNRNILKSSFQNIWKIAAAVTILLVSSFLLYYYISKPSNIVVTAQATNIDQVLPDGSVISLHAGSQIIYPSTFTGHTRNVELKGEAYFKVTHDKTKPFIVTSGNARVEVLGTQFNVNTKSQSGAMEVVLTAGKVSVYFDGKPKENVVLMPGEKALLSSEKNEIQKTTNADPNYMAWKTHELIFDNESLSDVINTLQNVYQTQIRLSDSHLAGCRVTATFSNQTLESVLQVLKETLDLKVKQNGNQLEVSGKICN